MIIDWMMNLRRMNLRGSFITTKALLQERVMKELEGSIYYKKFTTDSKKHMWKKINQTKKIYSPTTQQRIVIYTISCASDLDN